MRITTSNAHESAVTQLQRRQQQLSEAQVQLTSGKRVLRASDDPAAAARAERALAAISRSETSQRGLEASRSAMQLSESALGDTGELLQRAHELIVNAGNGAYTDRDRGILAETLRGLRGDLLTLANRSDGAGRYLFGGQGSDSAPLLDTPAGVVFVGAAGQLQGDAGEAAPLSVDGRSAWLEAPDPAIPGGKLSVFGVLDRVVTELLTSGRTGPQIALGVSRGLGDIDAVASNLSAWRSRTGESLNRTDGIEGRLSLTKLDAQRDRSNAEDLDLVAALSDFQSRKSGYDAALQTYSIVQRMSLFDFLR